MEPLHNYTPLASGESMASSLEDEDLADQLQNRAEEKRLASLSSDISMESRLLKADLVGKTSKKSNFWKRFSLIAKGTAGIVAYIPYSVLFLPGGAVGAIVGNHYNKKPEKEVPSLIRHFKTYANSRTEAGILVGAIFPLAIAIHAFEKFNDLRKS